MSPRLFSHLIRFFTLLVNLLNHFRQPTPARISGTYISLPLFFRFPQSVPRLWIPDGSGAPIPALAVYANSPFRLEISSHACQSMLLFMLFLKEKLSRFSFTRVTAGQQIADPIERILLRTKAVFPKDCQFQRSQKQTFHLKKPVSCHRFSISKFIIVCKNNKRMATFLRSCSTSSV